MQISLLIQLFLIISIIFIVVIIAKIYFKIVKNHNTIKNSIILSVITTVILHIPLYINKTSFLQMINNSQEAFVFYILSLITFSIIYVLVISIYKNKLFALDYLTSKISKKPTLKECRYIIVEHTATDQSYTIQQIADIVKIHPYKAYRVLNSLVQDKKANVAVNPEGDLLYFFK